MAAFEQAVGREGAVKLFSDGNLIKDVTRESDKDVDIFELRIHSPVAFRVYFSHFSDVTYLALLEKKPPKKEQSNQIETGVSILRELMHGKKIVK